MSRPGEPPLPSGEKVGVRGVSLGLPLALALLGLSVAIVLVGAAIDALGRPSSVEARARGYFAALERSDADEALRALPPSRRDAWVDFVENGLENEYRVLGTAVRHSSLIDRVRGGPAGPHDVTVFLDITEAVGGVRWQAAPRVPLVEEDGIWYLARPPLAPEPGAQVPTLTLTPSPRGEREVQADSRRPRKTRRSPAPSNPNRRLS